MNNMSLNWKEIDTIISEWNILHGKVQQVLQPNPHQLFFEIYVHKKSNDNTEVPLQFITIHMLNKAVRMHLSSNRVRKPKTAQRFQQLLQARLIGAKIINIEHINQDRIIQFTFEKTIFNEDKREQEIFFLYIKLWSNQANCIFCKDDNTIIDLAFRRPHQNLMPGAQFEMPQKNNNAKSVEVREWDHTTHSSFNEFIEGSYAEQSKKSEITDSLQHIQSAIEKQLSIHHQALEKTQAQIETCEKTDRMKLYGNLILAHQHLVTAGQTDIEISQEDEVLIIPLHKKLNAVENAEHYFNQAKKAKRSFEFLVQRQLHTTETMQSLKKLQERITEENHTLSDDERKLIFPKNKQQVAVKKDGTCNIKKLLQDGDYTIIIGRNAKENDMLLRKFVKGNDIWLHVRGNSGAYVFVRCPKNKTVPLDTLIMCGQLAAFYSKCKHESYADIYYTEVKHLKKVKNAIGLVTPMRSKNLQIKIDLESAKNYLTKHSISS